MAEAHPQRRPADVLRRALVLTAVVALVEAVGGWWSGSLALMGDAGHMSSDAIALGLALVAAHLARRPPAGRWSYGFGRVEVLAALANAILMLLVVAAIVMAALDRLAQPPQVQAGAALAVALVGLVVNGLVAALLLHGEQTLNVRGALLHVIGDLLGSLAAVGAAVVILLTGWTPIDAWLSLFICALIVTSALRLLSEAISVLMESVPRHLVSAEVAARLRQLDGLVSIHDLHIWTLSSGRVAFSAHVGVVDLSDWPRLLSEIRMILESEYSITHITVQPERADQCVGGGCEVNPASIHSGKVSP